MEHIICDKSDLVANSGVCALVNGEQVAIFYIPSTEQQVFAIANWDPFGKANVLSRGIIGDLKGDIVVASPLYKQHFKLSDGSCLEDDSTRIKTYPVTIKNDKVLLV